MSIWSITKHVQGCTKCAQSVYNVCTKCAKSFKNHNKAKSVHNMCTNCHKVCTKYAQSVHKVCTKCAQSVYKVFTKCAQGWDQLITNLYINIAAVYLFWKKLLFCMLCAPLKVPQSVKNTFQSAPKESLNTVYDLCIQFVKFWNTLDPPKWL
jgi:hypothetical protein